MIAPICLFTYTRLNETKRTVEALKNNYLASESELYIFSDGSKNEETFAKVKDVRRYLHSVEGFKAVKIIEATENKGLANSIISGVTKILKQYQKAIILEDDLITLPNFLNFMNKALDFYEDEKKIQSVNGFSLCIREKDAEEEVYFQQRPFSWGWATWSNRWNPDIFSKETLRTEVNENPSLLKKFSKACGDDIVKMFVNSIYDRNDSWYVRWTYNHFRNNTYSVYPFYSFIENIGFGESGTHCKGINSYEYKLNREEKTDFKFSKFGVPALKTTKRFLKYFSLHHKLLIRIKLLGSEFGREQVLSEIKMKLK